MDANIMGLAGKAALVIGGGFGIGRESSILLGRAGANVMVADLDIGRAEGVRDELTAMGVKAAAISGDVTKKAEAEAIVDAAIKFHGSLEVLINMVGLAEWGTLMMIDEAVWERQFAINLNHHIYVGTHAARYMIDNKIAGRMAFVASVSGIYGAPYHPAYGASKAGLMSLVRTMSQEWGEHGIRVNAVAPDVIATPRVAVGFESRGIDEAARNKTAADELVSLKRFGQPFEIAAPLVFLCSDWAGFMTGQTLIVDGGVNAAFPHNMNPFK